MRRSEYEAKMKALQDEIEALKKVEIEEDSRRWEPNYDDEYYYVEGRGYVETDTWQDWNVDIGRYNIGNCFKTHEEAEFMIEKLRVLAELKEFAEPRDAEWDGINKHWFIGYDYGTSRLYTDNRMTYRHAELHFASEGDARAAIAKVGEERIKKYYLEVE